MCNKTNINLNKTKGIVFCHLCPLNYHFVPSVDGVAIVDHVKIIGVTMQQHLSFDLHLTELLKQCSQYVYLLHLLRSQGPSTDQWNVVFPGLTASCLLHALPILSVQILQLQNIPF